MPCGVIKICLSIFGPQPAHTVIVWIGELPRWISARVRFCAEVPDWPVLQYFEGLRSKHLCLEKCRASRNGINRISGLSKLYRRLPVTSDSGEQLHTCIPQRYTWAFYSLNSSSIQHWISMDQISKARRPTLKQIAASLFLLAFLFLTRATKLFQSRYHFIC